MKDILTEIVMLGLSRSSDMSVRSADAAAELQGVHEALLPIEDADDLARKQLMSLVWRERVPSIYKTVLNDVLNHRGNAAAATTSLDSGETWKNVWWFAIWVPPTTVVHLYANRSVMWRVFGAGIPFYQEGWTDEGGYAKVYTGWAGGFASMDCLTGPGDYVQAVMEAFPGTAPHPGPPYNK